MKNVMLIDVESVKRSGYVHDNVLPDTIRVTILRVQQVMLRKVMGAKKYDELLEKVSLSLPPTPTPVPLDDDTKDLIDNYIQPYLIACVDYRIIYPLTNRIRSKSVGKGTDENHTPSETTDLIKLKDQMASDVDAYRETLVERLWNLRNCDPEERTEKRAIGSVDTRSIKFR